MKSDYKNEVYKLNDKEKSVLEYLSFGVGEAVKQKDITMYTGIPSRELVSVVRELREKGVLVGSTSNGYFLISTEEELVLTTNFLKARILKQLEIINLLEKSRKNSKKNDKKNDKKKSK